jgi:hypothetical protein
LSADSSADIPGRVPGARATVVGIDFDNTVVCYDELFHRLAVERSLLGRVVAPVKRAVRDHLRAAGREECWTELQAVAYGERIREARAFPGVQHFVRACGERGIALSVVSHKTERAYAGGDVDLRAAARTWLDEQGFFAAGALGREDVYFEATREGKIARVAALGCTHFVDDLPEFLSEPALPRDLVRILFAPDAAGEPADARANGSVPWQRARSWADVASIVFEDVLP